MDITNEKITPTMAAEWLECLPGNGSSVRQRIRKLWLVDRIKLAILKGQWRENGDTIVFNAKGELIDGQHRLTAIKESGKPVRSLVVRGVASGEETFNTIDDGASRTVADFLHCKNRNMVQAMARFYWMVINQKFPHPNMSIPNSDVLKTAHDWIQSMEETTLIREVHEASRISHVSSFFAFLIWYHTHIVKLSSERIGSFCEGVSLGANLEPHDPRLLYRNRCIEMTDSAAGTNFRLTVPALRALLMKAFYMHIDGRRISKLTWNSAKEEFPELRSR